MSAYGQDRETELHERLAAYIHGGGGDWGNAEDLGPTAPGSPDPLFDSPGPSNIASAFVVAAASNRGRTRSLSRRAGPSGELPGTEAQAEANADNDDGWTDTNSVSSRAASARPDATFAARAGGAGGTHSRGDARGPGYGGGGRPAGRSPPADFGMAGEIPAPAVSNVAVPYTCWSCSAMVSIRRKEVFVMCGACGGRIVMKVRPEQTVVYSTM